MSEIADDRLSGAPEIAAFLGQTERQVRYLLDKRIIPHTRHGRLYVASRRRLREWWEETTRGSPPEAA
jgi:hypothetical protein